jgi:hypothetical protein
MKTYACWHHANCEVIFRAYKGKEDKPCKEDDPDVAVRFRKGKRPVMVIHLRTDKNS